MDRRRWFVRFLLRSLTQRMGRVAVAVLSVTIAVTIVVSSLGLSRGIRKQLGAELSAYGANVIVTSFVGPLGLDQSVTSVALSDIESINPFCFDIF